MHFFLQGKAASKKKKVLAGKYMLIHARFDLIVIRGDSVMNPYNSKFPCRMKKKQHSHPFKTFFMNHTEDSCDD